MRGIRAIIEFRSDSRDTLVKPSQRNSELREYYRPTGVRRDKPACCRGASPYRKGSSESILTSSLAGVIVRCHSKRRQRHWWAGRLSFEKAEDQDADSIPVRGRQYGGCVTREWLSGPA